MRCKLTHARHDSWHCTTPGLFRSMQKGSRRREKLDVKHTIGGAAIHFTGFEPLGGNDLRLLQGLVAWAGPKGMELSPAPNPANKISSELRRSLQAVESGPAKDAIFLQVPLTALLREVGLSPSGGNLADAQKVLKRLASVTVFLSRGSVTASSRLLSYVVDTETRKLWVALNTHLASAIMGDKAHFIRINLDEVRALQTEAGRIIHQRLCAWINPGATRKVSVEVLCDYAWHSSSTTRECRRKRTERVHKAVADIRNCGWEVSRDSRGTYVFTRPNGAPRSISHAPRSISHKSRSISHATR
jgi:hypothetical protein